MVYYQEKNGRQRFYIPDKCIVLLSSKNWVMKNWVAKLKKHHLLNPWSYISRSSKIDPTEGF